MESGAYCGDYDMSYIFVQMGSVYTNIHIVIKIDNYSYI